MNLDNSCSCQRLWFLAAFACFAWMGATAQARSQPASPSAAPKAAVANAAPTTLPIPPSVFVLPTNPSEGRDPFFPNSTHGFPTPPVKTTNPVVVVPVVELTLKGISGPVEHRFAIINNRTFSAGVEGEVPTSAGPVKIRCLEIKEESVTVQVGSTRQVLHLRSGI
jgi:hypothetical protein